MRVFDTQKALREHLSQPDFLNKKIGFVPTMGALHAGHLSLMEQSLRENDCTVVSIFVNPTQFNQAEDLAQYPRTLAADIQKIQGLSAHIIVFAPEVSDMYADGTQSEYFDFSPLDQVMEGAFRPGHFQGVGTVVRRLFDIVRPTQAYFGEKDFQQLQIIRRLTHMMELPIRIVGCPIYREANGLAMSSRNERLNTLERAQAGLIYKALSEVKQRCSYTAVAQLKTLVATIFSTSNLFELEYFEIVDENNLQPVQAWSTRTPCRAFIAVWAGPVRLIDNMALHD